MTTNADTLDPHGLLASPGQPMLQTSKVRRSRQLHVLLTDEEYRVLRELAARCGLEISDTVRAAFMEAHRALPRTRASELKPDRQG